MLFCAPEHPDGLTNVRTQVCESVLWFDSFAPIEKVTRSGDFFLYGKNGFKVNANGGFMNFRVGVAVGNV